MGSILATAVAKSESATEGALQVHEKARAAGALLRAAILVAEVSSEHQPWLLLREGELAGAGHATPGVLPCSVSGFSAMLKFAE